MHDHKSQDHYLIEEAQACLRASIERSNRLIDESDRRIRQSRATERQTSDAPAAG